VVKFDLNRHVLLEGRSRLLRHILVLVPVDSLDHPVPVDGTVKEPRQHLFQDGKAELHVLGDADSGVVALYVFLGLLQRGPASHQSAVGRVAAEVGQLQLAVVDVAVVAEVAFGVTVKNAAV
jgi:hypothetical protein